MLIQCFDFIDKCILKILRHDNVKFSFIQCFNSIKLFFEILKFWVLWSMFFNKCKSKSQVKIKYTNLASINNSS